MTKETTLKEFKEWLNRFPEDTIVEVAVQQRGGQFESFGPIEFQSLDLTGSDIGEGWDFLDFRNNQFVKEGDESFGKTFLRLGESC